MGLFDFLNFFKALVKWRFILLKLINIKRLLPIEILYFIWNLKIFDSEVLPSLEGYHKVDLFLEDIKVAFYVNVSLDGVSSVEVILPAKLNAVECVFIVFLDFLDSFRRSGQEHILLEIDSQRLVEHIPELDEVVDVPCKISNTPAT